LRNSIHCLDNNGYDVGRPQYDTTPSPTDSGYSGYSGSKYTSPTSSTSSPKGPTNFIQKYEQFTGKRISSTSQSPRSSPTTSPIDNNQEYYNNGYPKRSQDSNNYSNAYDNRTRDPYGQSYSNQRQPPYNDRYNQQPPLDNRYNADDSYRTGKPRVPNDPYAQNPNDRYGNNRSKSPATYDNSEYVNKYPPPPSSNQPYYDAPRKPTYDRQNGYDNDISRTQPYMPLSQGKNNKDDSYCRF
jgi:hypothetical protein